MFGFIPLIIALLIADTTADRQALIPLRGSAWTLPCIMMGSIAIWTLINELVARYLARAKQHRLVFRWELVAQTVMLVWFVCACYVYGWSTWSAQHFFGYTLAIAPWVGLQAAHWWGMTPAIRSLSGHPWTRWGFVLHQLRFGVLPMVLILPFLDIGPWISRHWNLDAWFSGQWGPLLAAYCLQLFMIVLLILLPVVILPLWGVKRLLDGELSSQMSSACKQMGVRVAGLMRWPVPGGRIYNAAVIGMLPRLRFVLFTDDLIKDLPQKQVLAVLGHELGHARHGHLWLYFIFVNCTMMISFLIQGDLANLVRPLLGWQPRSGYMSVGDPMAPLVLLGMGVLMIIILFRFVFGYLSRACERQADLAGAELVGDPQIMGEALKSVAQLSGHPENEPSWRHYSIAERVLFLERVRQSPAMAVQHHHLVRFMRNGLIALVLLLFAALWLNPVQDRTLAESQAQLQQWIDRDHDLDMALQKADHGEVNDFTNWVNRADVEDRGVLAKLMLASMGIDYGLPGASPTASQFAPLPDDRMYYYYRNRLRPFANIATGDAALDLTLDNVLAYICVAGTDHPTSQDLAVAQSLLQRLVEHMNSEPDDGTYDTIACVYSALGNDAKAKDAWDQALRLLTANPSRPQYAQTEALYRQRLDSAITNIANAHTPGFERKPFPRVWQLSPRLQSHPPGALPMPVISPTSPVKSA